MQTIPSNDSFEKLYAFGWPVTFSAAPILILMTTFKFKLLKWELVNRTW